MTFGYKDKNWQKDEGERVIHAALEVKTGVEDTCMTSVKAFLVSCATQHIMNASRVHQEACAVRRDRPE